MDRINFSFSHKLILISDPICGFPEDGFPISGSTIFLHPRSTSQKDWRAVPATQTPTATTRDMRGLNKRNDALYVLINHGRLAACYRPRHNLTNVCRLAAFEILQLNADDSVKTPTGSVGWWGRRTDRGCFHRAWIVCEFTLMGLGCFFVSWLCQKLLD